MQVGEVSKAVGFDSRIGSEFLSAGPGFGGVVLKRYFKFSLSRKVL